MIMFLGLVVTLGVCNIGSLPSQDKNNTLDLPSTEPELPKTAFTQSSRQNRRFKHKIENGIVFLTGLKVGSLLSGKSHIGQGSLSTSNSFHLFGKPINSALSLSYGNSALPFVNDPIEPEPNDTRKGKVTDDGEEVVHLTIIRNDGQRKTERKTFCDARITEETEGKMSEDETKKGENEKEGQDTSENNFFKLHNKRVEDINRYLGFNKTRINSKFK